MEHDACMVAIDLPLRIEITRFHASFLASSAGHGPFFALSLSLGRDMEEQGNPGTIGGSRKISRRWSAPPLLLPPGPWAPARPIPDVCGAPITHSFPLWPWYVFTFVSLSWMSLVAFFTSVEPLTKKILVPQPLFRRARMEHSPPDRDYVIDGSS